MTRYRITISGPSSEAMADLVRKHKIHVLGSTVQRTKDKGHVVDAIAQPHEIKSLEDAGYQIERHEDVDEVGKARQREVGMDNRYMRTTSLEESMPLEESKHYLNVEEVESALSVATSAPYTAFTQLIKLPNLTWEGRQCHAIKIGKGNNPGRPGVYFIGGVHAREWGSADILITFVEKLEQAYLTGTGLTLGTSKFSANDIQTIVNTFDIIIFPQVNPDGRNYSMTVDPMWRKNRRTQAPNSSSCDCCIGVDINRNYDFLWDFPKYFSHVAPVQTSTEPCDYQVYNGSSAFSEPETKNVRWIFDNFPNIRFFIDLHSFSKDILYGWGDDDIQTTDQNMNFQNPTDDGLRGITDSSGLPGASEYKEYMPADDLSFAIDLANTFRDGIKKVRGTTYTVKPSVNLYPTSGASDDYAYSRNLVDSSKEKVLPFVLEWGEEFQPPFSEMQNIISEITSGLLAFCLEIQKILKHPSFDTERRIPRKATHPDSIIAEVNDSQAEQLKSEGESLTERSTIKLQSIEFDPTTEAPVVPEAMEFSSVGAGLTEENYWIVQFVGPVKPDWIDKVRKLGGKVGDYIPDNAFLVQMTRGVKDQVSQLEFVRWVGPYQPAYKISPLLMGVRGRISPSALRSSTISEEVSKPSPTGNLRVLLHKSDDAAEVSHEIEDLGGTVISTERNFLRVSLDTNKIVALARLPSVEWIEPYSRPKLFNDVAAGIISVKPIWNNHELDGEGQIIAVADTGLDTGINDASMHEDFKGRIVKIYDRHGDTADRDSGHGTHVAGSVLGSGARSNGSIRGMAFNAKLVFQAAGDSLNGIPDDLNDLFKQSYDSGARIFSNSWGSSKDIHNNPIYGHYTANSQNIDKFVWDHKDAVILFAAGNEGKDEHSDGKIDADSLATEASAKNCITIGASENNRSTGGINLESPICYTYGTCWPSDFPNDPIRNDRLSNNQDGMVAFSSRGPTVDGRIKPDVVAPGTNILSVRSSVSNDPGWGLLPDNDTRQDYYKFEGGTSMATPITAGAVALIRQYLQRELLPNPSAALVKALLIHGAVPMAGQYTPPEVGTVPNSDEGWGRINIENALFPADPLKLKFRDSVADAVGSREQRDYTFSVINTSVPFRATLVWTDYPMVPASGKILTNELRLSITAPDGTTTQGGPENNNVQQVVFNVPQIGTYTVSVTGLNIPTEAITGEKQDFALVVTAGL
jgi:subtilisin family serine protease/murein tripeptide amidase MpaA